MVKPKKMTRVRNSVAKDLRTPKYKQRVVENKRKDADPKDDYTNLDQWITREE